MIVEKLNSCLSFLSTIKLEKMKIKNLFASVRGMKINLISSFVSGEHNFQPYRAMQMYSVFVSNNFFEFFVKKDRMTDLNL